MGREEEQNLLGRSDRGIREDRGGCRAGNENYWPESFPCRLRSRFRPVLPRLQPKATAWEELEPRPHSSAVQNRDCKDSRNRSRGIVESEEQSERDK